MYCVGTAAFPSRSRHKRRHKCSLSSPSVGHTGGVGHKPRSHFLHALGSATVQKQHAGLSDGSLNLTAGINLQYKSNDTPSQILSGRYDFDYMLYKYCCKTPGPVDRNKRFSLHSRVTTKFLYNIRESVQNLSSAESSREHGGFHHCRMEPLMEPLWRPTGVPVSGMIMRSTHSNPKVQFVHLMSHLVVSELRH